MHRIMNSPFRLAMIFSWTLLVCLPAHSAFEKNSPAVQAMSWESLLLGKSISCAVRLPDSIWVSWTTRHWSKDFLIGE